MRQGEDRAFEELYSRYRARIGSYILGMVGDHGKAEDIAQDVFISALRRLRATDHLIAFKPWLYEIAKNACIDEFRRTRRVQEVPLQVEDEGASGELTLVSGAPTPEVAIESKQRLDDLCGAFGVLSENHHKVIVMRELEGLSYSQIGERLGMSRPMVESTLFRARRRLSEEYEQLASGERCQQVRTVIDRPGTRTISSLRIKERRKLSRHLAHCQPCRHYALAAGFDEAILKTPSLPAKIAALLPIPWLRLRRSSGDANAVSTQGSHRRLSPQVLQTAARCVDPAGPAAGLGRAAAAAAATAVAIVGVGGGLATLSGHSAHHSALVSPALSHGVAGHPGSASGGPGNAAGRRSGANRSALTGSSTGAGAGAAGTSSTTTGSSSRHTGRSSSGATGQTGGGNAGGGPGATAAASNPGHGTTGSGGGKPPSLGIPGLPSGGSLPSLPGAGSLGSTLPKLPSLPQVSPPQLPPVNLPPPPNVSVPQLPSLPPVKPPGLPKVTVP